MGSLTQYSIEFFPPKTDRGKENLDAAVRAFAPYRPAYFSVTYGAGGSTREVTLDTVRRIQQTTDIEAAPHLSCIGSDEPMLRNILQEYRALGVTRIIALRGDLPSGSPDLGDLRYASDLVQFIRQETGDHFSLEVAAYPEVHPQATHWQEDLSNFKIKVDAGANTAITQYFFNSDSYFRFVDDCRKLNINIPIIPGLMPITNARQLLRFSDACGAEIPRWIRRRLEHYDDDLASIRLFGEEVVTELCNKLIQQGVDNIHFYSMNQSEPTINLWRNLNVQPQA